MTWTLIGQVVNCPPFFQSLLKVYVFMCYARQFHACVACYLALSDTLSYCLKGVLSHFKRDALISLKMCVIAF